VSPVKYFPMALAIGLGLLSAAAVLAGQQAPALQIKNGQFNGGFNVGPQKPALVLVFHPYYAPNYEMSCERLSQSLGGLAWQVHFRQKQGKPNALKTYQFGLNGPSYSVALKGRAWISADNYQIVRMTDILGTGSRNKAGRRAYRD
jgi:hypothetical protein